MASSSSSLSKVSSSSESIIKQNNFSDLTLSHPEALLRQVKLSGVRQSKITKCPILTALGGKGLMAQVESDFRKI